MSEVSGLQQKLVGGPWSVFIGLYPPASLLQFRDEIPVLLCLSHAVTFPFSFHGLWMELSPPRSRYAIGLCCPACPPETP